MPRKRKFSFIPYFEKGATLQEVQEIAIWIGEMATIGDRRYITDQFRVERRMDAMSRDELMTICRARGILWKQSVDEWRFYQARKAEQDPAKVLKFRDLADLPERSLKSTS